MAQSQSWPTPAATPLPATTPALSPNYYMSLPVIGTVADTRMTSTAYYGNVKTVAAQNSAGGIQILYEYYTAATAGATASYSIGQILVAKVTGTCASSCFLGNSIDAGESLSTKDILITGVTDWNSNQGAAFIFKDVGFRFSQQAQLFARDGAANDLFGYAVSLDEFNPRRAFIGSPNDDDLGAESGSIYFFESSPTAKYWTEAQKLVAKGSIAGDRFGDAIQIDGRFAIATAPGPQTYPPGGSYTSGSCSFYTFEQEKPKPPPKPDPCQDSKSPKTLRGMKSAELQSAETLISKTFMSSVSPFADIKQTKSLQWSQQQTFSTSGCQGDLQISMYENDLAVGNQFKDNPSWVFGGTFLKDTGEVITYTKNTVRAPCTSSLFNTILTFTELVEMRDRATMQFWEEWGVYDDSSNSSCKRPKPGPKPTPICETTRWSQHQVITEPVPYNCSYFGSAVDMYGDYMVITARNMNVGAGDNCFFDGTEPANWQDGGFYIYHKRPSDGQWTMIQKVLATEVDPAAGAGYGLVGSPIQLTGTDILASYAGASATPGNKVLVTDTNYECVMFDLGDQFGDGWGGAELVITQQDGVQERYAPYCSSAGLNLGRYFRWCPHNQTMCGEITLEIPRAEEFPFHWEIIWGVLMEETDVWVYGGYDTKMVFNWDCDRKDLSLVSATNIVANETCDSGCQKFEPTMRPTPAKPKPDRTPDFKHPTSLPTMAMAPADARRLDEELSHDELTLEWRDEMAPDASLSAAEALAPQTPLRQLKKSKQPSTQHPTISPAPTLLDNQNAFDHWEFLKLIDGGSGNWFSPFGRSTEYYISDIHGKHLFKSGTKCANGALTLSCWQTLPPTGEFILRIGGNMNTNVASHTANFCGKTLASQSQLVFSINNHKCTPISYFTATRYCTNYLNLKVTMHGILLIHGVQLNALSAIDIDVLQQAFGSVFNSHSYVDVEAKAQKSIEGTVLTFSVSVSITDFGYEQNDFEAEETVAQTAFTSLSESFESVTFSSAFDEQVSAFSMRGTPSSFSGHGSISLQMLSDPTFEDKGPNDQSQLDPISFISESDKSSVSLTSHPLFNAGAFIAVLAVGMLAMAIYRHRRVSTAEKARDYDDDTDTEHGIGNAKSIASSTASFLNTMGFNVPPTGSVYDPIELNSEHGGEALVPSKSSSDRKSGSSSGSGSSKKKSSSKSSSSSVDKEKSSSKSRKSSSSRSRPAGNGGSSSRSRSSSRALSEDSSGSDDDAADLSLLLQESSRRRSEEKKGKFQPSQRLQSPTSGDTAGFNIDALVKALADSAVHLSDEE